MSLGINLIIALAKKATNFLKETSILKLLNVITIKN